MTKKRNDIMIETSQLSNDVIQEIMSFLTYHDLLLNVSLVNKRWYKLSCSDHLWRIHLEQETYKLPAYTIRRRFIHNHPEILNSSTDGNNRSNNYNTCISSIGNNKEHSIYVVNGGLRKEFLELLRKNVNDKNIKKKIDQVITTKKLFQKSYGIILPLLFFIGLCLCSILVPLQESQYSYLPPWWAPFLFISLPSYLLIVLSILIDPFLLNPIKDNYYHVLGTQLYFPGDSETMKSVNLLVWSLGWIPTSLLCIFLKLRLWSNISFSIALIPLFTMCAILLLVPPIIWYSSYMRGKLAFHENLSVFVVYCLCAVIGLFIVIQFGLIAGKLDGTILGTWGVVFIPIWLLFIVVIFSCPLTCFLSLKSNSEFFAGLSFGSCIICSGILPLMTFMILLSLKLDNFLQIEWIYMFIPLYIFEGIGLFILCIFGLSAARDGYLPEI